MNNEIKMSDDELAELIRIKNHQEGMTFAQLSGFFVMMSKLRSTHHLVEINTHDQHLARIAELELMQKTLLCVIENGCGNYDNEELSHHCGIDIESAVKVNELLEQSK